MPRGGKRQGAGSKPQKKGTQRQIITFRFDPKVVKALKRLENQTQYVEEILVRNLKRHGYLK